MAIVLTQHHLPLFAPPLTLPLKARLPGGLFGMDRHDAMEYWTTDTGHRVSYRPLRNHTGLDLAETDGRPVFAARSGVLVHISQIDASPTNLRLFLRHNDPAPACYVTRYLHVRDPHIAVGQHIDEGRFLALIGGEGDHLHFEVRRVLNPGVPNDWANENTEPVDPLPLLYRWEKIYYDRIDLRHRHPLGDAALLKAAAVLNQDGVWVFEVGQGDDWPIIPLLAPDAGEARMVTLLQDAYLHRKPIRLATRESPMFEGRRIIVGARAVGDG